MSRGALLLDIKEVDGKPAACIPTNDEEFENVVKLTLLEFHGQRNRPLQASIIGKRRFQPMRSLFI